MKKHVGIAVLLLFALLAGGCGDKNDAANKSDTLSQEEAGLESDTGESAPSGGASDAAKQSDNTQTSDADKQPGSAGLSDGVYLAEFDTDSGMFHVSEACEGKGTLTVAGGNMTIHISLNSKRIVNLYPGLAKDAAGNKDAWLMPSGDTVTYSDGMTEEVYGFDVPVPAIGEPFDLALVGTKGKWYDHKVTVSNPIPLEDGEQGKTADGAGKKSIEELDDGDYRMDFTFEGGSGRAKLLSPASVTIADGKAVATVQWSSPNYDYMLVDGKKYLPASVGGGSVFEFPIVKLDEPIKVIGDTVAMSKPHEVEYTLTFHSGSIEKAADTAGAKPKGQAGAGGLVYEKSLELRYAKNFTVDYYQGGYTLLSTSMDGARFLLVPRGKEAPEDPAKALGLAENTQVVTLKRPLENIYLVASSAMNMFSELGGLSTIRFSGQKADGWYIKEAKEAMEKGDILYAGKYNMPDYEMIVSSNCPLAIENMMISHTPEVVEKLADFGIPVLIDYSSYESHPLGRVEWVKFYGELLGKEKEAEKIFAGQQEILERVSAKENTKKTVAFFYITSNGLAQVRRPSDYIPKMIGLAGGRYVFPKLGDAEEKRSTMNMQIEEFYAGAKDADYLIYNSSIDGGVSGVDELLDKCKLLADFKAVKEGNVWCTTNDVYQQSLSIGYLMDDIHRMIHGKKDGMHYLFRLK